MTIMVIKAVSLSLRINKKELFFYSAIFSLQFINKLIVMRLSYMTQTKKGKEQLAITAELIDALREVNLNSSWKNGSSKFSKNRTGCMRADTKLSNLMTEQDLDKLFSKSKEKVKLKTEAVPQSRHGFSPISRDYTAIRFLQLEDQYDKMLTGLPLSGCFKENCQLFTDSSDLTMKFKKDYMVGKVIGQGAYASVRVAIFKPQNKKIAIKAYEKVKIRDPQRKKTVRRQIKILQMVTHPNIVKIIDVVQTNNHVNIIMEYLPGISLGNSIKQQPNHRFPEDSCKRIFKEIAAALKYLHEKNIAHRDIKLENIILDDKLCPKLIDFGFSTCIEKNKKMKIFCGTPSYMAPQIIQKKEYRGQAADIWALGVMLFVMLTGYFPYKGATDDELYQKINLADYPKQEISAYKKALHLISKMFIINPEERITAEGVLNHAWLNEHNQPLEAVKKYRNEPPEIRRLFGNSKEKSPSLRRDDRSRPSKPLQDKQKCFIKTTKDLAGKLGTAYYQPKFQRTMANPTRQDNSLTHKFDKQRKENQARVTDMLKVELKRRSEEKSKCKSHRM